MSAINSIKIRMYRHGFGDCFLLQFFTGATRKFTMLIDCGLKLNDKVPGITLENVRDDIAKVLKGKQKGKGKPQLDVLVATHEHWDHVSGFHPNLQLFDAFSIGKLWLAWTENPEDDDAKILNKGLRKRVKALQIATEKLKKKTKDNTTSFKLMAGGNQLLQMRNDFNNALESVLGFFGPLGVTKTPGGINVKETYKISLDTQLAMNHLRTLARGKETGIRYFDPGELVDNITELPGIRIYVLGPPKNQLLNKAAPSAGPKKEVYLGDSSLTGFVDGVLSLAENGTEFSDNGRPFGAVSSFNMEKAPGVPYLANTYFSKTADKDESWRTIEDDWLDMAGALAMQMDTDTNNTSLVLAIEFVDSKKVLLFPGDAQVGNWLSWHDHQWEVQYDGKKETVKAEQLLNNTIFYKAGHHASHNATLKEKGLEMMKHEDLVAFVPEKEKQYAGIPFAPLLGRLSEKTKGRLIVSADSNFPAEDVLKTKPAGLSAKEWKAFTSNITLNKLFVEYTVKNA